MAGVGIVGTGISGLQLALHLQRLGVDTTVYAPQTPDEQRAGRLPNCVMRWAPTIAREHDLGVFRWERNIVGALHLGVMGDRPLALCGRLPAPANTTDFRIYLPDLLEEYAGRGGAVVVRTCEPEDLAALATRHDLIVVAAGRDGFGGVFPRDPARSPHRHPARHITAGLYHGAAWPEPAGVEFTVIPGIGEIFQVSFHSFAGPVSAVAVEAIPGGPLDRLPRVDAANDIPILEAVLLELIQSFAPSLHARIDRSEFALTRPVDLLQGRLTPVVRRAWATIGDAKPAIAVGDAWILNDPIGAQGANLGSRCAFILGAAIAGGGPYDERFCQEVERRLWAAAEAPTVLSNALLEPPTPALLHLLGHASRDQAVADRFAAGFGEPEGMVAMLTRVPAAG